MARTRLDSQSQVSPRRPDGRRARVGPHLGPMRITPTRVLLAVALLGGIGFLLYAIIVRDALQIPLLASGFAIVALVFTTLAVVSAANLVRSGRDGRDGTAFLNAIVGGIAAIVALMCFAASVIMALIWGSNG